MEASTSLNGGGAREILLLGVLDANGVICSRELALVLESSGLARGRVLVVLIFDDIVLALDVWCDANAASRLASDGGCGGWADSGG